jgi:hypothetical protein
MCPKLEDAIDPLGEAKFTMLSALKNSARNSIFKRSVIGKYLFPHFTRRIADRFRVQARVVGGTVQVDEQAGDRRGNEGRSQ